MTGDLEVDPLAYLLDEIKKDPASYQIDVNLLEARVKIRETLWKAHLVLADPYKNFLKGVNDNLSNGECDI